MIILEGLNNKYKWKILKHITIDGISYHVYIYDIGLDNYIINDREFQNEETAIDFLDNHISK
jgi:hypothetical protein